MSINRAWFGSDNFAKQEDLYLNTVHVGFSEKQVKDAIEEFDSKMRQYGMSKTKHCVAVLFSRIQGFDMIAFLVKGKTAKTQCKKGYQLAFCYNLDEPMFSEFGDIVIELNSNGEPYRVG